MRWLALLLLLSSCSASWHIKKAMRLDPTLFEAKTDTVRDTLEVIVPSVLERVQFDTLVEIVEVDPITNTEYVIKYKIEKDSIYIDCPDPEIVTETIYKEKTVVIKPTIWEVIKDARYGILALIGVVVLVLVVRWVKGK